MGLYKGSTISLQRRQSVQWSSVDIRRSWLLFLPFTSGIEGKENLYELNLPPDIKSYPIPRCRFLVKVENDNNNTSIFALIINLLTIREPWFRPTWGSTYLYLRKLILRQWALLINMTWRKWVAEYHASAMSRGAEPINMGLLKSFFNFPHW